MRLAVVTILRNEIDIVRPFLSHIAALFDHAVLLDHGSVDGTDMLVAAACAERPNWNFWRIDVPGHHQALFSSFAMRHLFDRQGVDVVVFLDADEFIDVPDRPTLCRALQSVSGERTAGLFEWVDCLPARLDAPALQLNDPIWVKSSTVPFTKAVVSRQFYEATGRALRPSSGNHTIEPRDGGPIAYHTIGRLLHLPARSVRQFRQKIITGSLAVLARSDTAPHESTHWFEILRRLADADLTSSDLIHLASQYGSTPTSWNSVTIDDLQPLGFSLRRLSVAGQRLNLPDVSTSPRPWQVMAAVLCEWRADDGEGLELELAENVLRKATSSLDVAPSLEAAGPVELVLSQAMLAILEAQLARAQQAHASACADVAIIRASTSYRITWPLRALTRLVRRQRGPEPVIRAVADVTVVVTSCARHDLLDMTLASFRAHNTDNRVGEVLVVEDGLAAPRQICERHGARLLCTGARVGQVVAIDMAYAQVDTPLVFHLEDDWEFYRPGFMEPSREVLRVDPSCIVVNLRAWNDLNDQPLSFAAPDRSFGVVATEFREIWHGFTWNPGLRRMSDYRRLGRYGDKVKAPFDVTGQDRGGAEAGIGALYYKLGYRAVVLEEAGYVRHLGWGRTVGWTQASSR